MDIGTVVLVPGLAKVSVWAADVCPLPRAQ
jgi:hypothetical protein